MKKRPLIVVEWDDTCSDTGWEKETKRSDTAIKSISVGWRLPNSGRDIVLTPMRNEFDNCNDRQIIPRGCIKSIRRLE